MASAGPVPNFDAVIALEQTDIAALRAMSDRERGALIDAACAAGAEIEAARAQMGLPPVTPAPWPESTWIFLAEWARRARE